MPHDSPETIKKAYRKLVMQYHPDLHPEQNKSNTLMLQEINEAFAVLSDPEKKRIYDLRLYSYLQRLKNVNSHKINDPTPSTSFQASKNYTKKVYIRRNLRYQHKNYDPNSKFIKSKDFIAPLLIIALLTILAFYIRFKNEAYKIEPFQKSSIKIDIYSVNLSGKLSSAYLPNDFFDYTQITQLDLSNNQLTYLSPKFGNLKNLRALNLNNNLITHLNDGFTTMKNMVYLNLSNNPLNEFPEEILYMEKLEVLWLENCSLAELPIDKMNFPHLKYLFLSKNPLNDYQKETIKKKFSKCYLRF